MEAVVWPWVPRGEEQWRTSRRLEMRWARWRESWEPDGRAWHSGSNSGLAGWSNWRMETARSGRVLCILSRGVDFTPGQYIWMNGSTGEGVRGLGTAGIKLRGVRSHTRSTPLSGALSNQEPVPLPLLHCLSPSSSLPSTPHKIHHWGKEMRWKHPCGLGSTGPPPLSHVHKQKCTQLHPRRKDAALHHFHQTSLGCPVWLLSLLKAT